VPGLPLRTKQALARTQHPPNKHIHTSACGLDKEGGNAAVQERRLRGDTESGTPKRGKGPQATAQALLRLHR
jgi:hypothetical protein